MEKTIHITVRSRVPTITEGEDVISHNSDYVIKFDFDEEWQSTVKTVYFACEDGSYQPVVISGNICPVPMLDGEHRRIFVGVQAGTAEKPSVLKTTRPCCLKVKDSIADYLGQPIPDPTPDVYEQIIAMLESITSPTWDAVQNKPFTTLGDGLEVDENGVLSAQGGGGGSDNAVQYVAQSLTDEQKTQARENIGAKAATEKSAYIISRTRSYGYIHTSGMDFDGVYALIQSGKVVMLLVDNSATYYGVITTVTDKTIMFYNIRDMSQSDVGGRNKGITYFGFTWHKGDDSLTEWWGDIPSVEVDETLTKSGSAADAKAVGDVLTTKLDKNQGTGNAGKILGIGEDGNVVPQDKPSGSTVTVDDALSSTSVNPVQNKVVTAALAGKITAPTTAAVGQIIKVKSVDTSGKPTEWEAADLPSGGGRVTTIGKVTMDGKTTVVQWDLTGETIIIVTIAGTTTAMGASTATVKLTHASGASNNFATLKLNASVYSPKNVTVIMGNGSSRIAMFLPTESTIYTGSIQGKIEQGVTAQDLPDDPATKITITFDTAPVSGTTVKVEGQ